MSIMITAGADGNPLVYMQDVKNYNIGGVGSVTGSGALSIGANSDGKTQYSFANNTDSALKFTGESSSNNYSFTGQNISATLGNKSDTVVWNAQNSVLNANGGNDSIYSTTNSTNNQLNLGSGDDILIEDGDFNFISGTGDNSIALTDKSEGSVVSTGSGSDTVAVQGKNAFVYTGSGDDKVATSTGSTNNVISTAAGADTIVDKGSANRIFGGSGADTAILAGLNGISEFGTGDDAVTVNGKDNLVYLDDAASDKKFDSSAFAKLFEGNSVVSSKLQELYQTLFGA